MYAGTVTVSVSANGSVETNDGKLEAGASTEITATASGGSFTSIGGNTYKYFSSINRLAAVNGSNITGIVKESHFSSNSFDLNHDVYSVLTTGIDVLDLTSTTGEYAVLDSLTNPTKSGSVNINGSTYTVKYASNVKVKSGSITVNGVAFNGTGDLTIDDCQRSFESYDQGGGHDAQTDSR